MRFSFFTTMTIPGTHNSMTYKFEDGLMRAQNVPLDLQLTGGIRYIDVTCKDEDNELMVYHGHVNTRHSFRNVLRAIIDFLEDHPGETIILRIQQGGIFGDSEAFVKSIGRYLITKSEFGDELNKYIYSRDPDDTTPPTIGKLRGKVLILQDFETSPPGLFGLPWDSQTVSAYHRKVSAGGFFLDSKWASVKENLDQAPRPAPPPGSNKLYITHTTASVGVSPINIAARNSPDAGMNKLLGEYLKGYRGYGYGIVVMDFPGQALVGKIIEFNNHYRVFKLTNRPPNGKVINSA
ncbi:1-phosphatidylinositol phosphodiesterase [Ceratocystis platani]|uniref:1-phosphatidylinositol phosphodiesterase n=1 Tax=Ceratocystis fimbriata f. sp. platani TaxID=88771 RepID=A0A0F8B517_CERFI|nr:1-phosphatidylinositol phosphodiesterase [Ceratocystis platani]